MRYIREALSIKKEELPYRLAIAIYGGGLLSLDIWLRTDVWGINDQILKNNDVPAYDFCPGPLPMGAWVHLFSLLIFMALLLLPKIMNLLSESKLRLKDGGHQRAFVVVTLWFLLGLLAWLGGLLNPSFMIAVAIVALLIGGIEGCYYSPISPPFLKDGALSSKGKRELVKSEQQRWWWGLQLFVPIAVGVIVGGTLTFASFQPLPELPPKAKADIIWGNTKGVWAVLIATFIGAGFIVLNIIRRINAMHHQLEKLWRRELP